MAALLALMSSIAWGTGDYVGGLLSRRRSPIAVVLMMQCFGLAFITIWLTVTASWQLGGYVAAGVAAGLTGTLGLMAFYKALSIGTMGVVAPIAAMGVIVPLLYGLMLGDQPTGLQWLGIVGAIAGVVIASAPELTGQASPRPLIFAVCAAAMFGVAMALMAAGAAEAPGMTVFTMRAVQAIVAVGFWIRWRGLGGIVRRDLPQAALTGFFDVSANVLYTLAAAMGPVSMVAVLGSFPPVATAVLGRFLLKERLTPLQYGGVTLALVGAIAITAG